MTGPDASGAADAQIVTPDKKLVVIVNGRSVGIHFGVEGKIPIIIGHILKLAVAEQRTAPFVLRHVGRTLTSACTQVRQA